MGGFVEAMLGAGIGAAGAAVNNAKHDQQQLDADAAEGRIMNREAALMYLRDKYAKGQAEHADGLARGRATFENDLKLDSLNDERVTQAEGRKRQGEVDDYDIKKKIDNDYASEKETRDNAEWGRRNGIEFGQQKGLVNMKLSAIQARKGRGGGDDDDAADISDPDFVKAHKDLSGYLGVNIGDIKAMVGNKAKLGLGEKATTRDVDEVMESATNVYAANPHISPKEATSIGRAIAQKQIKLMTVPLRDGRNIQMFKYGNANYAYGRPFK